VTGPATQPPGTPRTVSAVGAVRSSLTVSVAFGVARVHAEEFPAASTELDGCLRPGGCDADTVELPPFVDVS